MAKKEPSNNQVASDEVVTDEQKTELEQAELAAKALEADSSKTGDENTADQPSATPTKSPEDLEQELAKTRKSYDDLRSEFTRRTQSEAEMAKKFDALQQKQNEMLEAISGMNREPYDPDKFMEDFRTQGPEMIQNMFDERIAKVKEEYNNRVEEQDAKARELETQLTVIRMANDPKNYPDFVELIPEIDALNQDASTPVDFSQPVPAVMTALYNLAKSRHSQDAVTKARELGRKEAEELAAKEANSTVAGGGKQSAPTAADLEKLPIDKLEAIVKQLHGQAEER